MAQKLVDGQWIDDTALTPGQFGGATQPTYPTSPTTTIKSTTPTYNYTAPVSASEPVPSGYSTIPGPYDPVTGQLKTAAPAPAPAGSVASLGDYNVSGYSKEEQDILDAYTKQQRLDMTATFDPKTAYKQNLALYQTQIDAINNIYQDQLNRSRIENAPEFQSRIGSQTAMAARGGLLGSDPGKAMVDNQINDNKKVQAAADAVFAAERNDKIAAIYGRVANSVESARARFEETKAKSTEDFIASIKARPEERKRQTSDFVKALLAQGLNIQDLSPEELQKFASKIGVSTGLLVSEYNTQFSEVEAAQREAEQKQLKADADLAKTEADTAKTVKETEFVGKMTPYQAAQIGISSAHLKIAQERAAQEEDNDYTNYSEENIPQNVKLELTDDLAANAEAGKDEKKSLVDFFNAYPEVETEYIMKLFTNYDVKQ